MSDASRSSIRRGWVFLVAAALLAPVSVLSGPPAGATDHDSGSYFSIGAASSPVGVEYFDSGAPVIPGEIIYASVAATRAALDSVGNSAGFAGGPYLGDNVPALMGAANALGPAGAILPPYPFMVASQYPGESKASQEEGPRKLSANSSEHGSDADAHVGLSRTNPGLLSVSSTSVVKRDPATGALAAKADGVIQGFSVGAQLAIGQLTTTAEMIGGPGQAPTKRTALSIGSLMVNGTLVGLTDKGFVPVPGTPKATDFNSLTKQLAAAGITIGLLPSEETPTGLDSAAVVIGIARQMPGGLVRTRIILGRVRVSVTS